MSLFTKNSKQETKERAKWVDEHDLAAHEAILAYKKGKADRDSVRKVLQNEDDYFNHTD